jgi:hypothetical protein
MCPDAERADRERNREIELFERIEPNDPSVSNAQLCVKKFSRIVDNPHCSSIRTRAALDKTCAHLYGLLGGRCDYPDGDVSLLKRSNFLWDRLRSVRQDMGLTGLLCGDVGGDAAGGDGAVRHRGGVFTLRERRDVVQT